MIMKTLARRLAVANALLFYWQIYSSGLKIYQTIARDINWDKIPFILVNINYGYMYR